MFGYGNRTRDDVLRRAENAEWSPKEGRGYIPGTYLERVGRATRFPFLLPSGRSIGVPQPIPISRSVDPLSELVSAARNGL